MVAVNGWGGTRHCGEEVTERDKREHRHGMDKRERSKT